jgi:hypothetical protein
MLVKSISKDKKDVRRVQCSLRQVIQDVLAVVQFLELSQEKNLGREQGSMKPCWNRQGSVLAKYASLISYLDLN